MDQAAMSAVMITAVWQIAAPLVVAAIVQVGVLIYFLGRMSKIHEFHEQLHVEHKKKLDEHAEKISRHGNDIAALRATLD